MDFYELKEQQEYVILIGVQTREEEDTWESLLELEELAKTAGALTAGKVIQSREAVHPGTYIGSGKIEEVRQMLTALDATGVICDDELTPAQMNNLQRELDCKVMDRTLLILDIFAGRATTSEGKIQVELAQLKYRAARLTGLGNSLSRLGGGIGTRGPGEKKLEMDRRLIRNRISQLKQELSQVQRHRDLLRARRKKGNRKVGAIVGYTNAGKSTLLNTLTNAQVLAEDKLFATLDPTTRVLNLEDGQQVLLTDTVGFIRKLPHHLVEAFKSTLEEAKYADFIIHVVDASNPERETQMQIVYEILRELGAGDKTVVTVFNKQDKIQDEEPIRDFRANYSVRISAREGSGLEELKSLLGRIISQGQIYLERLFPYHEAGKIQLIRNFGLLLEEEYRDEGIAVKARIPREIYEKVT